MCGCNDLEIKNDDNLKIENKKPIPCNCQNEGKQIHFPDGNAVTRLKLDDPDIEVLY